jgi:hypothetical protein
MRGGHLDEDELHPVGIDGVQLDQSPGFGLGLPGDRHARVAQLLCGGRDIADLKPQHRSHRSLHRVSVTGQLDQ